MNSTQCCRRYFQIGHVAISIVSRNSALLKRVGDWLDGFEVDPSELGNNLIRFTMIGYESNERIPFILPADARLLYKNDYTQYYEYRNLWVILLQTATVIINRSTNKMIAFTHYNDLKRDKYLEDFMHPLVELLRQNGVYAHHAAAVSREGCGILLLGKSGQGKTTLSVDLLNNGFDFLADDRCFLWDGEQGLEVHGFYEPIRYFPENINHIQAINDHEKDPRLPELYNGKSQLDLNQIYREKIINKSRLVALVFPHFSPEEQVSRIEPMPKSEPLITMLPLTMVCFDRTTSRTHFDFSVKLTTLLPSVKLIMGQDRERWHELINEYMDSIQVEETTA